MYSHFVWSLLFCTFIYFDVHAHIQCCVCRSSLFNSKYFFRSNIKIFRFNVCLANICYCIILVNMCVSIIMVHYSTMRSFLFFRFSCHSQKLVLFDIWRRRGIYTIHNTVYSLDENVNKYISWLIEYVLHCCNQHFILLFYIIDNSIYDEITISFKWVLVIIRNFISIVNIWYFHFMWFMYEMLYFIINLDDSHNKKR